MKRKSAIIFYLSIILLSNLYAQDNHKKLQQKLDSLETRIGSLETKVKKISIEQVTNNLNATDDTLNWGTGFWGGGKSGTNYTFNYELGYMFRISKNPLAFLSGDYLGKRKDYRVGISAGMQWFYNEPVFKNDLIFYKSTGYGVFGKVNFGSPVLLNFLSFSWHLKVMYTIPAKDNDHDITAGRMVFGYGNDLEFWLTENGCVTIGYTDERDSFFGENKDDPIYPSKIRFVFGFKAFF